MRPKNSTFKKGGSNNSTFKKGGSKNFNLEWTWNGLGIHLE